MTRRAARGRRAEVAAQRWLRRQGLQPLASNYRCRFGEIDLIMLDGDTLVIVEVRSRTRPRFVHPAHSVDWRKQGKIVRSTEYFLSCHPHLAHHGVRFDVVAVSGSAQPEIEWLRNAFIPES